MSIIRFDADPYGGRSRHHGFAGHLGHFAGDLKIVSVNGNVVEVSGQPTACAGKTPELRRHATGINEFVGDITNSARLANGHYKLSLDFGVLKSRAGWTMPKKGATVYVYCSSASGGGGGSTGGGDTGGGTGGGGGSSIVPTSTGGLSGIPTWALLVGGGVLIYLLVKK